MELGKNVTLEITLTQIVAKAALKKSDEKFGKGNVSQYFNWLIRNNCSKIIEELEKETDAELEEVKTESSKPKVITTSESNAGIRTKCEICGLPIHPTTRICKGIYDDGTETNNFVHRTCCED
jgi:hypothetical protein